MSFLDRVKNFNLLPSDHEIIKDRVLWTNGEIVTGYIVYHVDYNGNDNQIGVFRYYLKALYAAWKNKKQIKKKVIKYNIYGAIIE